MGNDAKYGFGRLDLVRWSRGRWRPVVVAMAVEEFKRLKALDSQATVRSTKVAKREKDNVRQ